MRTWFAVSTAVSEANSPKAHGISASEGTRFGSALTIANSAFSLATR